MRTLAAPSDGDVACTRNPPVSFSSMTTSPGVIINFSSISSRSTTSTRIGWLSMPRSVRVAETVTCSSTVAVRCSVTTIVCRWFAASSTATDAGAKPAFATTTSTCPAGIVSRARPSTSVLNAVPFAVTLASRNGASSARTSTSRIADVCADARPVLRRKISPTSSRNIPTRRRRCERRGRRRRSAVNA
jgi:hypothetical protein